MINDQKNIYNGLKNIGEAIANFYIDALEMIGSGDQFASKANLLAHLAREIDGGLRDVFAPDIQTNENKQLLKTPGKKDEKNGHFASILAAVGKSDPNNALAKKWLSIAESFPAMAHRHHIHSSSRDAAEMLALWKDYEKVLDVIIGSFIAITNRLDNLLNLATPQLTILPALKNILRKRDQAIYFYSRLDKPLWLKPLMENGFFEICHEEIQQSIQSGPGDWPPIKYLLNISLTSDLKVDELIKKIVHEIIDKYINGEFQLHAFTIDGIVKLIVNMPNFPFTEKERQFFELFAANNGKSFINLVHGTMAEFFAGKYIETGDKESVKELLKYFLGFTVKSEPSIAFFNEVNPTPYLRRNPNVEDFYIQNLFRRHAPAIMDLIGEEAIRIAIEILSRLHVMGAHAITKGTPASIEESDQSGYNNGWEDQIIYFIRDYASSLPADVFEELINEMLFSKIEILQRIGIHFVRVYFETYQDLWWNFIARPEVFESEYVHEPYLLIKEHSAGFNEEEFEKTISWIEKILLRNAEPVEAGRGHVSYRIRRWLTALQPSSEKSRKALEEINNYYMERNSGKMTDHPEFYSYGQSFQGPELPLSFEEFIQMNIGDQINYIAEFVPEHDFDSTREGLAQLLRAAILGDPNKYLFSLDMFILLPDLYLSVLINSYTELLNKDGFADYAFVLDFIECKINHVSFNLPMRENDTHKRWLIFAIGSFVSTVAVNGKRFDVDKDDALRMMGLVIGLIENDNFQGEKEELRNGYINYVLNSMHGKLYDGLIATCTLYAEQFVGEKETIKWPAFIKDHFTNRLAGRQNSNIDFSISLGMEMPKILSWDIQWVNSHLPQIFDESNQEFLDYKLSSMFSRYYQPSMYFYQFLKTHNLYTLALNHFKSESPSLEVVMTYALMEWGFWQGDPEKDSILATVFEKRSPEHLKKLIGVAWEIKILSPEQVLYLWERLLRLFETSDNLRTVYSQLIGLFDLIPALAQAVFDLATNTIAKISDTNLSYNFLRHLYNIADSNYALAGKLLLQVYEKKLAGLMYEQELKVLVEKMYGINMKAEADRICILIGELGSLVLKDIYNKNN